MRPSLPTSISLILSFVLLLSPFSFYCSAAHRDLHSFPTRRSSDLASRAGPSTAWTTSRATPRGPPGRPDSRRSPRAPSSRSEEHTSELQSRFDLVCRLLLEKKKKKYYNIHNSHNTINYNTPHQSPP